MSEQRLMTPEAEACVKACEAAVAYCITFSPGDSATVDAGRASLAAKKPKERWQWAADGATVVGCMHDGADLKTTTRLAYPTEAHARAAAEALNRVGRGE